MIVPMFPSPSFLLHSSASPPLDDLPYHLVVMRWEMLVMLMTILQLEGLKSTRNGPPGGGGASCTRRQKPTPATLRPERGLLLRGATRPSTLRGVTPQATPHIQCNRGASGGVPVNPPHEAEWVTMTCHGTNAGSDWCALQAGFRKKKACVRLSAASLSPRCRA